VHANNGRFRQQRPTLATLVPWPAIAQSKLIGGVMEEKIVVPELEHEVDVAGMAENTRVSAKVVTTVISAVSDVIVAMTNKKVQQ
jgi:hypothetical protein